MECFLMPHISSNFPAVLPQLDRRQMLYGTAAMALGAMLPAQVGCAAEPRSKKAPIVAFTKFVQSLGYEELGERIAAIGFDGIESTVRNGGHVDPAQVEVDLPKHVEAVRKAGIDVTIITTDVLGTDQPLTEKVLRTAADLGIKQYRMGFYRYDLRRSVMDQLNEIRPRLRDLAALNRDLGLNAVYQNHSGNNFVGAPIWDVHYLLEGIPREEIGIAFDIRHATVEGGLSWPLQYDLMKPSVGAVFVKDFQWKGRRDEHVPLGKGRVDPKFFAIHEKSGIECPYSIHVEYLPRAGADENLAALATDLKQLKSWL
jgi:sugar phosphate isomerase/epimerase